MSEHGDTVGPRLYGNWRRVSGFGIGRLSTRQSATVAVAIAVPIAVTYLSVPAALVAGGVAVLVLAGTLLPVPGGVDTVATMALRVWRFRRAEAKGHTEWVGGVLTRHARRHGLPGPMAPVVPLSTDDGRGGKQGLLWDRRSHLLTAVLRYAPVGLELADQEQADQWVAAWAAFLSDLGCQPMIAWVAATVDTAPAEGVGLVDSVAARRSPQAPVVASEIMDEAAASTTGVTSDISSHVAITFDPSKANPRPKDLLGSVAEVTRWLPRLEQSLSACGVTVLARASVPWLVSRLAIAYDPAERGAIGRLGERQQVLQWRDAAPLRARETPSCWEHASGTSTAWVMRAGPQQAVTERTLAPLLSPGPYARRFTLLYDPLAAEDAAKAVESEVGNLAIRREWARRTRRDTTQREADDLARARQATREEAQGAGVTDYTIYISTTVTDPEQLPAACADVEQRAAQAKPLMRQARHAQAATFAAALGLGVNPADLEGRRG